LNDFFEEQLSMDQNTFLVELKMWLVYMTSSANTDDRDIFSWIGMDVNNDKGRLLRRGGQPWLHAKAANKGKTCNFLCIVLSRTANMRTSRASFLAPKTVDLDSVTLYNANGSFMKAETINARSSQPLAGLSLRSVINESNIGDGRTCIFCESHSSQEAGHHSASSFSFNLVGQVSVPKQPTHAKNTSSSRLKALCEISTTLILLKRESLASRSAGVQNFADTDAILSVKELIMAFLRTQTMTLLVGDGCGSVHIILKVTVHTQDILSGIPLIDMSVLFLINSCSLHHAEKVFPESQQCMLTYETRELLTNFIAALASHTPFDKKQRIGTIDGHLKRLFLPAVFPSRRKMSQEPLSKIKVQRVLKPSSLHTNDGDIVQIVKTLKEYGNRNMKEKSYSEAVYAYTVGALLFESEGSDESAQCLCNLALASIHKGAREDWIVARRSCTAAIRLMPRWGKPYYRRGLCHEKFNDIKMAFRDFNEDSRLSSPTESKLIRQAVVRVNKKLGHAA
jgi:hypothetical protein